MKILTSEAVFIGHPDKICDQISDAVLDACLAEDKSSRVAIETLIKDGTVVLAGEISTHAHIDYEKIAKGVLLDAGYEDADAFRTIVLVSKQSPDIAIGVDKNGAGDQGIMYGYAVNECQELMPLPIVLARKIAIRMNELRKEYCGLFMSDGKCQVSVEYDENDNPKRVSTIVVSQQVAKGLERKIYSKVIIDECILQVIPKALLDEKTEVYINPTGEFVVGGPYADSGLTGRKIICDTYGGIGRHGGGAFSGKDATKVDRLAAYYARYVAKNIVASGIARECEVQIAYAIGVDKPVALNIETFGTSKYSNDEIKEAVNLLFNFKPRSMRIELSTDNVKYRKLAEFGHIGRSDLKLPWERTNKAYIFKSYMIAKYAKRV